MRVLPINQNFKYNNQNRNNKNHNNQSFGAIIKNNFDKVIGKTAEDIFENSLTVIAAPSGTGKDTLVRAFNEKYKFFDKITTCTTRKPRPGEVNGRDYHFLTADEFRTQIQEGRFLEFENVFADTFYGTRKEDAEKVLSEGKNAVLVIDVNGAKKIKEIRPKTVSLFITPPSMQELERRLTGRGTETPEMIQKRLARAEYELKQKESFDVILQNDSVEESVEELAQIFHVKG